MMGGGGGVFVCGWCCGGDGVFKIDFKFIEKFLKWWDGWW